MNREDRYGFHSLIHTAPEGHVDCMKYLMNVGADVNHVGGQAGYGWDGTALMFAADNDHILCVDILLRAGADVNIVDSDNDTVLIRTARSKNKSVVCVHLLLQSGAKINMMNNQNMNALMSTSSPKQYQTKTRVCYYMLLGKQ